MSAIGKLKEELKEELDNQPSEVEEEPEEVEEDRDLVEGEDEAEEDEEVDIGTDEVITKEAAEDEKEEINIGQPDEEEEGEEVDGEPDEGEEEQYDDEQAEEANEFYDNYDYGIDMKLGHDEIMAEAGVNNVEEINFEEDLTPTSMVTSTSSSSTVLEPEKRGSKRPLPPPSADDTENVMDEDVPDEVIVGTCLTMCPVEEIEDRTVNRDLSYFELVRKLYDCISNV